jgi:hypothetical protein
VTSLSALVEQDPSMMIIGHIVLTCLLLWLLTRGRLSRFSAGAIMSGGVVLPVVATLIAVSFSEYIPPYPVANSTSVISIMFVGAAVWWVYREHALAAQNKASAASELLILEMPLAFFLGLFHRVLGYPIVAIGAAVFFLIAVGYQLFLRRGTRPSPETRGVLVAMSELVLVLISFPVLIIAILVPFLSFGPVILFAGIMIYRAVYPHHDSGSAAEQSAHAMVEMGVLFTVWQAAFLILAGGVRPSLPGYPNPYYGLQIVVCGLFSLLAVVIVRLLLAVWRERTKHMASMQVRQTDTARDLS